MADKTFYWHSGIHGACPSPCPCPCFMSMLNIHVSVHVHAAHQRWVRVRGGVRARVREYKCRNAGLSGIRTVRYRNKKKITMPGQVWYWTKPRQSGILLVRYRTVIIDAGMPMPALGSWMPMPSYAIRLGLIPNQFLGLWSPIDCDCNVLLCNLP